MSRKTITHQLTLFAEDFPARMCPLPESGRAWLESEADFGLSSLELLQSLSRNGSLSKMSLAFYPATEGEILPSSFAGWSNAGMASPGGFSTLSISESPSAAVVCSLSEVLETVAPPKYYLSAKAAAGILRRAERSGKTLPTHLDQALRTVATKATGE